jgi:hypothetical protein
MVGRSVTSGTPGSPALRAMNASRLVSTTKCRISSVAAVGLTHRRRNQTQSASIVECAVSRTGKTLRATTMRATTSRASGRTQG